MKISNPTKQNLHKNTRTDQKGGHKFVPAKQNSRHPRQNTSGRDSQLGLANLENSSNTYKFGIKHSTKHQ